MPQGTNVKHSGRIGQSTPIAALKANPTFMKHLRDRIDSGPISNFCAFPTGTGFSGQDADEQVVVIARQHPIIFLPQFLTIIVLIVLAFILPSAVSGLGLEAGVTTAFSIGSFLMLMLAAMTLSFDVFIRWYFGVNIITNKRIIDVDYLNVMHHRFSETRLANIEDVTHKVIGILGMIFHYGTVYVQTAGSQNEFEFDNVPDPNLIQDALMDLLEIDRRNNGR